MSCNAIGIICISRFVYFIQYKAKAMSYTVFLLICTHRNYKALYGPHISMRGQIQFLKKSWLSFSRNHLLRKNMIGIYSWLPTALQWLKNEGPVIRWRTTPGHMRWASLTLIGTQVCFLYHAHINCFAINSCSLAFGCFESHCCFPFVNIFVLLVANFLGKGYFLWCVLYKYCYWCTSWNFYKQQFLIIVFILNLKSNCCDVFWVTYAYWWFAWISDCSCEHILYIPYLRSIVCKVSSNCIKEEKMLL